MKKMYRFIIFFLILVLLLPTSIGCWDVQDVNRRSIVTAVGVNKYDDDIVFCVEMANLFKSLVEKEAGSQKTDVFMEFGTGKTFSEARAKVNMQLSFPIFLGATRVVIFGKNFSEEGVESYINRINKTYDYRKTLPVVVCDSPKELAKVKVENNISTGFLIENIIRQLHQEGKIDYVTVSDLISNIASGHMGFVLPYLLVKGDNLTLKGFGIFDNNSKLIDVVEKIADLRGMTYLLSHRVIYNLEIPHKEKKDGQENMIMFRTVLKDYKVNIDSKEGKANIELDFKLDSDLLYQNYNLQIMPEDEKRYEKDLEDLIEKEIVGVIKKSQEEYKCDIFRFYKYFRAQNPKEYRDIDWNKAYPGAEVDVNVDVKIVEDNNMDYEIDYYDYYEQK